MYKEKKTDFKPNKETIDAIREIDEVSKNLKPTKSYDNVDEMLDDILK